MAPIDPNAPVTEIALDERSGEFKPVSPVAARDLAAPVSAMPPSPQNAQQSFFEDDAGELLFSGPVLLDGVVVRVRELTAAEMTIYNRNEKTVNEMMNEVRICTDEEKVIALSEKISSEQMANYDFVIARAVASWELARPDGTPVPCTAEAKTKLRASKKAELTDKIIQRSTVGRDLSGFLAAS